MNFYYQRGDYVKPVIIVEMFFKRLNCCIKTARLVKSTFVQ
jgi:hypothetical protein